MPKVYILGHKYNKEVTWLARLILAFTKNGYFHTSLFIEYSKGEAYQLNFDIQRNASINPYPGLEWFKKLQPEKIVDEEIPMKVTTAQANHILKWWRDYKKPYSKRKALIFVLRSCYMPFFRWYYRVMGKPYKSWLDVPERDICATIVDQSVEECLAFDIIEYLSKDKVYPGLLINALKKRRQELKNE